MKATGQIPQHIHDTMTVLAVNAVRGNMKIGAHDHLKVGLEATGGEAASVAATGIGAVHLELTLEVIGTTDGKVNGSVAIGAVPLEVTLKVIGAMEVTAVGKPNLLTMRFMESDKALRRGMRRLET